MNSMSLPVLAFQSSRTALMPWLSTPCTAATVIFLPWALVGVNRPARLTETSATTNSSFNRFFIFYTFLLESQICDVLRSHRGSAPLDTCLPLPPFMPSQRSGTVDSVDHDVGT